MKNAAWSIILCAAMIAASGCASTSLTGYTDPAFEGRSYQKVAVYVETRELGDRQALEYAIAKYASNWELRAFPTIELLPPTRAVDRQIVMEAMRANGYDAVLYVRMTDAGSQQDIGTMNMGTGPSVYSYTTLHAEFDAILVEVESGGTIWQSSSDSSTSDIGSWNDLLNSYANTVIKDLKKKGLII